MPQSYISPRFQAIDLNGRPLVGGLLYTYANTTTTPQATYQDSAGVAANTNPIVLDDRGEAVVFLQDGLKYTWVLKTAGDVLVWSQDDISGTAGGTGGITVVNVLPTSDIGPVYLPGQGTFYWDGTSYVTDFARGFGGGAFSLKNKVINGDFRIWQAGTSIGPITSASNNPYTADQWRIHAAGSTSVTVTQQVAGADFGQDRVGAYTARITSNAAATPGASDRNRFSQPIEGQNLLALALGSLWGGSFTVSFWVKASIVGDYCIAFLNGGSPSFRSYVRTFPVGTAGTWEKKTLTIPIDQGGIANWDRTNGLGMQLVFDLGSGTNYEGAVSTWLSTETTRATGSIRTVSTSGATLEISKVQIEPGNQATPFEDRPISQEFAMCQRYYEVSDGQFGYTNPGNNATTVQYLSHKFAVQKRATPTVTRAVVNGTVVVQAASVGFVNWNFQNAGMVNNVWSWIADARF